MGSTSTTPTATCTWRTTSAIQGAASACRVAPLRLPPQSRAVRVCGDGREHRARSEYHLFGPAMDFMHAPTQSGSVAFMYRRSRRSNPTSATASTRSTAAASSPMPRDVDGSLVSAYQTPFMNFSWKSRPGLIWKAEYNFFGYGEGGPSGAQYCNVPTPTLAVGTVTALVVHAVQCEYRGVRRDLPICLPVRPRPGTFTPTS